MIGAAKDVDIDTSETSSYASSDNNDHTMNAEPESSKKQKK